MTPFKDISLANSARQTKPFVKEGKDFGYGVPDSGLGPKLVTGTVFFFKFFLCVVFYNYYK